MKLKIFTQVDPGTGITKIWMFNDDSARDEYLTYDGHNVICMTRERGCITAADQTEVKPLMVLPSEYARNIIGAFAEYAEQNNIKTETKSFKDGKLQATEKHLENSMKIIDKLLEK